MIVKIIPILLLLPFFNAADSSQYLYKDEKDAKGFVVEYQPGMLDNFEKHSNKPRIVEFYNPHCGFCISYVPKYIEKARETKQVHPAVEFHAVSCGAHNDICQKYGATAMPTVMAFKQGEDKGIEMKQNGLTEKAIMSALGIEADTLATGRALQVKDSLKEKPRERPKDLRPPPISLSETLKKNAEIKSRKKKTQAGDSNESDDAEAGQTKTSDNDADDSSFDNIEAFPKEKTSPLNTMGIKKPAASLNAARELQPPTDMSGLNKPPQQFRKKEKNTRPGFVNQDVVRRTAGAGAQLARDSANKDMNRYKELLAEKVKQKKARIQANPFNKNKEDALIKVGKETPRRDAPTKRMRENTPGTKEYKELQEKKKEKIDQLIKKHQGGLRHRKHDRKDDLKDQSQSGKRTTGYLSKRRDKEDPRAAFSKQLQGRGTPGAPGNPSAPGQSLGRGKPGQPVGSGATGEAATRARERSDRRKSKVPLKKELPEQKFWQKAPIIKRMASKMSPEEELILDASLSFLTSLKQGVYNGVGPLPTSRKLALISWFELLSVSLPPEWALHETIDDLLDNIEFIAQEEKNLNTMLEKHKISRTEWSPSCFASSMKKGGGVGFSCGFWKLLHLITIGIAEQRGGLNLIEAEIHPEGSTTFSPLDAADAIYTYIKNFYPCETCKKHFVATYDQCSNNRRCDRLIDDEEDASDGDWQELGKWLWEVHNDISVRVLNERNSRKSVGVGYHPKTEPGRALATPKQTDIAVLFPSLEECVACFRDDGTWDEDAIFLLLEKTYWIGFDSDSKADRLLRYDSGDDYSTYEEFKLPWLTVIVFVAIITVATRSPQKAVLYRRSAGLKRSE